MLNNFEIEIHNEEHSRQIQDKFFELGFSWGYGEKYNNLDKRFLVDDGKKIGWNASRAVFIKRTLISTEEFLSMHPKDTPNVIYIDGKEVEFTSTGIKVGCTEVTHADLKTIYKASKKNQK